MEIVVPPPEVAAWILLGIPALVLVVSLALRGKPILLRALPVAFAGVLCGGIWHVAMRPMRFAWDERGVRAATFGDDRLIAWSDIREARLVRAYRQSAQRPVRRTNGTYYSGFGSGTWGLADGQSVRVFFEPTSDDALLVTTAGQVYLWSPRSFVYFLDAARAHVRISGDAP